MSSKFPGPVQVEDFVVRVASAVVEKHCADNDSKQEALIKTVVTQTFEEILPRLQDFLNQAVNKAVKRTRRDHHKKDDSKSVSLSDSSRASPNPADSPLLGRGAASFDPSSLSNG